QLHSFPTRRSSDLGKEASMTDYLNERTTTTKEIFNGKMISLQEKEVILPNGNTANREIVKHPGAVAVLPITKEGDIIFVEQFRKAVEQDRKSTRLNS